MINIIFNDKKHSVKYNIKLEDFLKEQGIRPKSVFNSFSQKIPFDFKFKGDTKINIKDEKT